MYIYIYIYIHIHIYSRKVNEVKSSRVITMTKGTLLLSEPLYKLYKCSVSSLEYALETTLWRKHAYYRIIDLQSDRRSLES